MIFNATPKLSSCEIIRGGRIAGTVTFNAYDAEKRAAFFNLYNDIVSEPATAFCVNEDKNGVPGAYTESAEKAAAMFDALARGIDDIFGRGTTALLTDGNKDPAVLLEFLAFSAKEFRIASGLKIETYLKPAESGVME